MLAKPAELRLSTIGRGKPSATMPLGFDAGRMLAKPPSFGDGEGGQKGGATATFRQGSGDVRRVAPRLSMLANQARSAPHV